MNVLLILIFVFAVLVSIIAFILVRKARASRIAAEFDLIKSNRLISELSDTISEATELKNQVMQSGISPNVVLWTFPTEKQYEEQKNLYINHGANK